MRRLRNDLGVWGPGQPRPTPLPHIRKGFLRGITEIYRRGRNFEADFRYARFFSASGPPTHPTPEAGCLPH